MRRLRPVGFACLELRLEAWTSGGPSPSFRYGWPVENWPSVASSMCDNLRPSSEGRASVGS